MKSCSIGLFSVLFPDFLGGFTTFALAGFIFSAFVLTNTETVSAQTRRSAAAIPYSFEEQLLQPHRSSLPTMSPSTPSLEQQLQFQSFAFLDGDSTLNDNAFEPTQVENFDESTELGDFSDSNEVESDPFTPNEFDAQEFPQEEFSTDEISSDLPTNDPQSDEFPLEESPSDEFQANDVQPARPSVDSGAVPEYLSEEQQDTPEVPLIQSQPTVNPVLRQSQDSQRPAVGTSNTLQESATKRDFTSSMDEDTDWDDSSIPLKPQERQRLEEIYQRRQQQHEQEQRRQKELWQRQRQRRQQQRSTQEQTPIQTPPAQVVQPAPLQPALPQPQEQPQQPQQPQEQPSDGWQATEQTRPQRETESAPAKTTVPSQPSDADRVYPPSPGVYPSESQQQQTSTYQDSGTLEYPQTDSYDEYDEYDLPQRVGDVLRPAPVPQLGSYQCLEQSCEIGPNLQFPDQCGYGMPLSKYFGYNDACNNGYYYNRGTGYCGDVEYYNHELAPFACELVTDPYAPLLDIGGPDVNFWGYPKPGPPIRPFGWLFDNMLVFGGVSGFGTKAGLLKERNVGMFEGVNWSSSFSPRFGIGAQLGIRCVQRSLDGHHPLLDENAWDSKGKSQVFFTGGFFRRSMNHPLQFGAVYDLMSDNKLKVKRSANSLGNISVGQLRSELSYRCFNGLTFGFQGAFAAKHGDSFKDHPFYQVRATNYYLGFIEAPFVNGSAARISAGGAKHGNAVLSAMHYQPLNDYFSLQTNFSYMFPKDGKNSETSVFEDNDKRSAWEIGLTLTFHPHGGAFRRNANPLRAMFDVAGNGSMIVSNRK